jgi:hypothetical protein
MAEKGSGGLFRMLADLAEQPELLERFKDDESRRSVLKRYDLDKEQIELLEKALDDDRHDHERYGHMTKLIGDEASARLVPLC